MYTVVALDGQKYGPVDLPTLNAWAADGRVVPTTTLESADGQRLQASQVPGIVFGAGGTGAAPGYGVQTGAPGYGAPTMGAPGMGAPGMGAPGMGAPGQGGYGDPSMGASGYAPYPSGGGMAYGMDNGQKDVTTSYVLAAFGFLCCPIVPMIFGIVYAGKALAKGNPGGNAARIVNIVLLVLQVIGIFARVGRVL